MRISRFNPTTNGPLHVGHIYNALVCQAISDRLILRFDDNQQIWRMRLGDVIMEQYAAGQLRDLLWMGIRPDTVSYQSQMEAEAQLVIAASHWQAVYDNHQNEPIIVNASRIEGWGTSFPITAEKVVFDYAQKVTVMARGLELLQENALYLYLCGIFGYPQPKMIYIPRLMTHEGEELTDVSKTRGNWKIKDLRDHGTSPETILTVLRESCLVNPDGDWQIENLKGSPVLTRKEGDM